jgi:hypothetical protein
MQLKDKRLAGSHAVCAKNHPGGLVCFRNQGEFTCTEVHVNSLKNVVFTSVLNIPDLNVPLDIPEEGDIPTEDRQLMPHAVPTTGRLMQNKTLALPLQEFMEVLSPVSFLTLVLNSFFPR